MVGTFNFCMGVQRSHLIPEISYSACDVMWSLSIPPGKCSESASRQFKTTSSHNLKIHHSPPSCHLALHMTHVADSISSRNKNPQYYNTILLPNVNATHIFATFLIYVLARNQLSWLRFCGFTQSIQRNSMTVQSQTHHNHHHCHIPPQDGKSKVSSCAAHVTQGAITVHHTHQSTSEQIFKSFTKNCQTISIFTQIGQL
jgi:hypothetical protein